MNLSHFLDLYSERNRRKLLLAAAVWIALVAFSDWMVKPNAGLGFLYVLSIIVSAAYLQPARIFLVALLCASLREIFSPFTHGFESIPRIIFVTIAFCITGLVFRELARSRQTILANLATIQAEIGLRREAEEQVRILVESSPAAIFILGGDGKVLVANEASRKLLGFEDQRLEGESIWPYLPVLEMVQRRENVPEFLKVELESRGRRRGGERFPASLWVSTYRTRSGTRLAAIVADASEDLRNREESGLDRLLSNSRIVVAAVSHEVRNLCGAINIVYANLTRVPGLSENEDFLALGRLTDGLRNVAAAELLRPSRSSLARIPLEEVFDDLRILVQPLCRDAEVSLGWNIPESLPPVRGNHQGLLQVLLNLVHNSLHAMQDSEKKSLLITGCPQDGKVTVRIGDSGPGVAHPELLFQPFQPGASATGLGLYVSRAIVRTFGGDLRYEAQEQGSCFVVELRCADPRGSIE